MNQNEVDIRDALTKAFLLGQVYWQQAFSEHTTQWKKADVTREKYNALLEETAAKYRLSPSPRIRSADNEDASHGWTLDRRQLVDITLKATGMSDVSCIDAEAVVCALIDLGYLEQPEKAN
jgi:type VI protein secretion system component VasF